MLKHHVISLLKKVERFTEDGKRDFIIAVESAPGVLNSPVMPQASFLTASQVIPFGIAALLTNTSPETTGDLISNAVVTIVFLTIPYLGMIGAVQRFETWNTLVDTAKRRLFDWHKVLGAAKLTRSKKLFAFFTGITLATVTSYIASNFDNGLLWSAAFFFGIAIPCNLIGKLTSYRTKYLMYMCESIETDLNNNK